MLREPEGSVAVTQVELELETQYKLANSSEEEKRVYCTKKKTLINCRQKKISTVMRMRNHKHTLTVAKLIFFFEYSVTLPEIVVLKILFLILREYAIR